METSLSSSVASTDGGIVGSWLDDTVAGAYTHTVMLRQATVSELKKYFINDLGWGWGYQAQTVFDFLLNAAGEAAGGVVLDAGAGHQRYKPFFNDSIYIAQEHPFAGVRNKGLTKFEILSDVRRIPLKDRCVDLVLSTSSLEHMEYPESFFSEAHRVLRPGCGLHVNVPFIIAEHETPFDFQRPTRYGLKRYYDHAGFERVTVRPVSGATDTATDLLLMSIKEDGRRLGVAGKAFAGGAYILATALSSLLTRVLDRGPYENSIMPAGWVSTGYVGGRRAAGSEYRSAPEFVEKNADRGPGVSVKDGRILVET